MCPSCGFQFTLGSLAIARRIFLDFKFMFWESQVLGDGTGCGKGRPEVFWRLRTGCSADCKLTLISQVYWYVLYIDVLQFHENFSPCFLLTSNSSDFTWSPELYLFCKPRSISVLLQGHLSFAVPYVELRTPTSGWHSREIRLQTERAHKTIRAPKLGLQTLMGLAPVTAYVIKTKDDLIGIGSFSCLGNPRECAYDMQTWPCFSCLRFQGRSGCQQQAAAPEVIE